MKILKIMLLLGFMATLNSCSKEPVNHDYDALMTQYWPKGWGHGCAGFANYIEQQKNQKPISFSPAARLYLEGVCLYTDMELACTGQKGESFSIGDKETVSCAEGMGRNKQSSPKKTALELYQKAYELDKTDKHGVAYYAELVYGQDTTPLSLEVQKQAIHLAPDNEGLLTNLAESYLEFGDKDLAISNYKKAIHTAHTLLKRPDVKINQKVEFEKEIAKSYYEISDIYYDLEDYGVALTYLKKGLKHAEVSSIAQQKMLGENFLAAYYPDSLFASLYNKMGMTYDELDENDKAIESYNKAIEKDKTFLPTYNNLGHALEQKKSYKEAIGILNKALKLDTDKEYHDMLYYNLARSYRNTNCKKALQYLQLSLKNGLIKNREQVTQNAVHFHLGRCYFIEKFYSKAITYLHKNTDLSDDSYYYLGHAYLIKKDYAKAVENLEQALESDLLPKVEGLLAKARKLNEARH